MEPRSRRRFIATLCLSSTLRIYATHLGHSSTRLIYATRLRDSSTPLVYATLLRHSSTPLIYATHIRHSYTPLIYATHIRHSYTLFIYATHRRHSSTPLFVTMYYFVTSALYSVSSSSHLATPSKTYFPSFLAANSLYGYVLLGAFINA